MGKCWPLWGMLCAAVAACADPQDPNGPHFGGPVSDFPRVGEGTSDSFGPGFFDAGAAGSASPATVTPSSPEAPVACDPSAPKGQGEFGGGTTGLIGGAADAGLSETRDAGPDADAPPPDTFTPCMLAFCLLPCTASEGAACDACRTNQCPLDASLGSAGSDAGL